MLAQDISGSSQTHPNSWYSTASGSTSSSSSSVMIGPPPTFYDIDAVSQVHGDHSQYQQWIDALSQASTYQQSSYQQTDAQHQRPYRQDSHVHYNYTQHQYAQPDHYMNSVAGSAPQAQLEDAALYNLSFPPGLETITPDPNPPHASYGPTPDPFHQRLPHQIDQVTRLNGGERSHSHSQPISEPQYRQSQLQQHPYNPRTSELMNMVQSSQSPSPPLNTWTQESRAPEKSNPTNDANSNQSDIPPVSNLSKKTTASAQTLNPAGKPRQEAQSQRRARLSEAKGTGASRKAGAKRKRPNPESSVADSLDGNTSEDDSDDEDDVGGGINVGLDGLLGVENKSQEQVS
ncbi:hypothetical protein H0H81_004447 [Sphagnurus paluster]|uniref:Uncharacterized protein n=1 Tax=Sphagnurus paluster TaxID=117069 RepID=A0A9P7FUP9_9AGAR|nr:hypothetical protein H0H81_004447 [Sphagnurus paluster]